MQYNAIYFLIFILVGFACADLEQPVSSCGENETFITCPPPCPATCDDRNPELCVDVCLENGCVCKEGYIRKTNEGPCVLIEECPSEGSPTPITCGCNEVLNKCPTQSPEPTCEIPTVPTVSASASSNCSSARCECQEGYIRIQPLGTCVRNSECKDNLRITNYSVD
ncbi:unnamed protein product [Phyllotreta striolata]|uniref:TIL domain-containing protein n=1 Tax=Phyllotreta striolata TaxID=444603 RepID=A0A9N9TQZ8_PHYSR|nr:unnamed protein product [Phyllotreta striolata]